tara:strand:+ start:6495 stop:7199 length:705 start_codon:yes stop_codon:yes gene_type:complete
MKIEVTDATTLPTWLQSHVSEGSLDLSALAAPEDVSGLKTALSKERGNAAAYSKYGSPDDIDARFAELTEKAKGNGKGSDDAQAKLDAMKADYEGKLTGATDRISKMMQRGASSDLKAELAKAGFISESIDDIASSAMGRLKFTEDGTAQVMTSDGKPMIGNGADHGATLADLAMELATSKSYAVRDAGKGGGGKPAGSQGGTPEKLTSTWSDFNLMSQADRMAFSKSGGEVKD